MVSAPRFALLALSLATTALAAKGSWGEACDVTNNKLDASTYNFVSDCGPTTYCNAGNGTCANRGCRRDVYPFGYAGVPFAELPPLCPEGQYCPDEGDHCMPQADVGGECQLDRDDQCKPPPESKELASFLNINGSVCLNFTCYYANVDVGQTCFLETLGFTGTEDDGTPYYYTMFRDNCKKTHYCDNETLQCNKQKRRGTSCVNHKECLSYNCVSSKGADSGVCGRARDEPIKPGSWVYAVIGVAIVIVILGVMVGLWFLHRSYREENQIKLEQYYNEQIAYRQSIMSMSHAKNSLLSLPLGTSAEAARASLYDDSQGYSTGVGLLPPNMRREGSVAWSEDSEFLMDGSEHHNPPGASSGPRYRG